MKKRVVVLIALFILNIILISFNVYKYFNEKYNKIEITLKDNLTIEFLEEKKVSDFIESINGNIIDDYIIDSTSIGKKDITFEFINEYNRKLSYTYTIDVVDVTEPFIMLGDTYSVAKNSNIDLTSSILCGDDYDSNPTCVIEGEYDLGVVGEYPLTFKASDSSGNIEEHEFTLKVYEPSPKKSSKPVYKPFSEFISEYKNENTEIGIDVSGYQKEIDFEKLKNAGVEFIIIKVGGNLGSSKEYYVDSKFIRNITEVNKYGIKVGIYIFSYADSIEYAINDAKWVLEQIKPYKIDLPIVYDWEDWNNYNKYNLSFYELSSIANKFLSIIEENGYKGMLYSSKLFLENVWLKNKYPVWLAHYINKTNYSGEYEYWQLSDTGEVDGIDGPVDINIHYLKK